MDKAGPRRVTPPPTRPGALKKPAEVVAPKEVARPVTPPKAGAPSTPPGTVASAAATAGSGVTPKPTPRSPPPIGLSSASSPTTPPRSERETSGSPGKSGESEESKGGRDKLRSPLGRRPQGAKQRARFAKGNYGDQRVKFRDPIDNRGRDGGPEKGNASGKGKPYGKGKGKSKDNRKGKQKRKSNAKGKGSRLERKGEGKPSHPPGGGGGKR